jgi:hypothetical protein
LVLVWVFFFFFFLFFNSVGGSVQLRVFFCFSFPFPFDRTRSDFTFTLECPAESADPIWAMFYALKRLRTASQPGSTMHLATLSSLHPGPTSHHFHSQHVHWPADLEYIK